MDKKKKTVRKVGKVAGIILLVVVGFLVWLWINSIKADTSKVSNLPSISLQRGKNFIAFSGTIIPNDASKTIFGKLAYRYNPQLSSNKGGWERLNRTKYIPKPGESFYIYSTKEQEAWSPANVATYTPTDETKSFNITLYPGWNMVANPYSHGYLIGGLWVNVLYHCPTGSEACIGLYSSNNKYPDARKNGIVSSFYEWDSKNKKWSEHNEIQVMYTPCAPTIPSCITPPPIDILTPKTGYWIQNKTMGNLTLSFSAIKATDPLEPPKIDSLQPNSGVVGTKVTIKGSGFTPTGNRVKFGDLGNENNPKYDLDSSDGKTLVFRVPSGNYLSCWYSNPVCAALAYSTQPGVYPVSVINANGTSNELQFEVKSGLSNEQPFINKLTPDSSPIGVGQWVTITGQNLPGTGVKVHFGSLTVDDPLIPADYTLSSTTMKFKVPTPGVCPANALCAAAPLPAGEYDVWLEVSGDSKKTINTNKLKYMITNN